MTNFEVAPNCNQERMFLESHQQRAAGAVLRATEKAQQRALPSHEYTTWLGFFAKLLPEVRTKLTPSHLPHYPIFTSCRIKGRASRNLAPSSWGAPLSWDQCEHPWSLSDFTPRPQKSPLSPQSMRTNTAIALALCVLAPHLSS